MKIHFALFLKNTLYIYITPNFGKEIVSMGNSAVIRWRDFHLLDSNSIEDNGMTLEMEEDYLHVARGSLF